MPEQTLVGHEFKLERDTGGGWGSETFSEVKCKKVDVDFSSEEIDTTRRGSGFMSNKPGLQNFEAKVTIHYRKDDASGALETHLAALRTASLNKTSEIVQIGDGLAATSGTVGLKADCYVFGFTQSQDINGDAVAEFTLKNGDTGNEPVSVTTP